MDTLVLDAGYRPINRVSWQEAFRMVFTGRVESIGPDDSGCCWADLTLRLAVEDRTATECTARVALPADEHDNPWKRRGERWKP